MNGSECPFISEKLCSIQQRLGEEFLSKTCATYPRTINVVDDMMERSLDLSCPEAARLVLSDPNPAQLQLAAVTNLEADQDKKQTAIKGSQYARPARDLILSILQDRKYPVSKRLILVGHVCDKLSEIAQNGTEITIPKVLNGFACAINAGMFNAHLNQCSADPAIQLGLVLELIVSRIKLDFTPKRYLNLHQEFMEGLEFKTGSTVGELGIRYAEACDRYYAPFMHGHEYMMEHYLVNYAYKRMFPFGSSATNQLLGLDRIDNPIVAQYILMATHYAITRAVMIGLAGKYKSEFGVDHVIRCVQSCARMLEHCTSYPARVLELLSSKGITNTAGMAILTQDFRAVDR